MISVNVTRRNDIDWLRVFATYLLLFFHVGKVFDVPPFYQIKNSTLSEGMGYFTGFVHIWHMPLFFLLAGWSVFKSLEKRSRREFLIERIKRIYIPFIMGCIMICPSMQFVYARTAMDYQGTFYAFLPLFFTSLKYFSWSHLWFLIYLLVFTLIYFALFAALTRRNNGEGKVHPALVYLPVIVLIVIQITLRPIWPGFQNLYNDWANFTYYSSFFILGFLFSRYPTYEAAMHRQWISTGIIGLFAILALLIIDFMVGYGRLEMAVFAVASYCLVIFILGFGYKRLLKYDRGLPYFRESAYPVYILHQASIVLPGFFIVKLELPIFMKYFLLLFIAVSSTLLIYNFIVRPFGFIRFFFGMRTIKA